jgi:prepilin-type N-terminal cleavage/methylation domain-containing protein
MKLAGEKGLTLVELLITITIMGIIATATMPMLSTILEAHSQGTAQSGLYHEGLLAMERMTSGVRRCTFVFIPNAHDTSRDILAFSGFVNEDGDYYFNDPLFPRIDEDPKKQMTDDGESGIKGLDDDGDALIDEGDQNDDDEDGLVDEDPFDGIDNDGDGNIDEDTGDDANIADMDDDADGSIDEGDTKDDDEDGIVNEDPLNSIVYSFDSGTNTLTESVPSTGQSDILSTRVIQFQTFYLAPGLIKIKLVLEGNDGETYQLFESAYSENTFQKTGKRVR